MASEYLPERRRPLYESPSGPGPVRCAEANAGLWYDKFCNEWAESWDELHKPSKQDPVGGKLRWVQNVAGTPVGSKPLLEEALQRQAELVDRRDGATFKLATVWRLVSGLGRSHPVENGFAWHYTLGAPYLPGSGVKGVARAWAVWTGFADIERFFGPRAEPCAALRAGSVIFLDALPVEPVGLDADVMTPHYGPWYREGKAPGDWHSPTPIPFLTVAPGQTFQFALLPRTPADAADCEQAAALLRAGLETLGAGAKTAAGYGVFGEPAAAEAEISGSAEASSAAASLTRHPARLPSGTLVHARLSGKNKNNKWKAVHDESGVEAVIEGDPPDNSEVGQVHELLCTSGTNFKWPNDQDRQRLAIAAKHDPKPSGKDKHGRQR